MAYQAKCYKCNRHFIWVNPHPLWGYGLTQAVCPVDLSLLHRTTYHDPGRICGLPPKYRLVEYKR
jgi:hypothetical protein